QYHDSTLVPHGFFLLTSLHFPQFLKRVLGGHLFGLFLAFADTNPIALAPDQDLHLEQFLMVRPCLPDRPVTREHLELPLADLLEIGLEVPPAKERPIARDPLLAERGLDARRRRIKPCILI